MYQRHNIYVGESGVGNHTNHVCVMLTPLKSYLQLAVVWRELLQKAHSNESDKRSSTGL